MSEERIKISELVEELAVRSGLDKNRAERLLKSLFAQIEQGLKRDGAVKINKFGTFKLQPIEARKSVDVTTGKEIMLEPYNKVIFTPDSEVKQRVNEPFAFLEPVVMENNDNAETTDSEPELDTSPTEEAMGQNLQKLDEQADEIKALLSDINGDNWFMGGVTETVDVEEDIEEDELDNLEETVEDNEVESAEWEISVNDIVDSRHEEQTQGEEAQNGKLPEVVKEEPLASMETQESERDIEPVAENKESAIQRTATQEKIKEEPIEQETPEKQTTVTAVSVEQKREQDKEEDNTLIAGEQEATPYAEKTEVTPLQPEPKKEEPREPEKSSATAVVPPVEPPVGSTSTKKAKKQSGIKLWQVGAIIAVTFCLILVGVYFYMVYRVETWANGKLEQARPETEWIESLEEESATKQESAASTESSKPTAVEEPRQQSNKQTATETLSVFEQPRNYDKLITTEQLTEGSRLAWLAKKYYGDARFWVYIYEANMDHIPDPNNITIGTAIKVPELPKELIDASNPACIDYAKQLHERFIK